MYRDPTRIRSNVVKVRAHPGPEQAHRNARYKGRLTAYEPDSGEPVVKI